MYFLSQAVALAFTFPLAQIRMAASPAALPSHPQGSPKGKNFVDFMSSQRRIEKINKSELARKLRELRGQLADLNPLGLSATSDICTTDGSTHDSIYQELRALHEQIAELKSVRPIREIPPPPADEYNTGGNIFLTDQVLDNLKIGICILDSNFHVVWINKTMEEFFQLRRDEVIGEDNRKLISQHTMHIFENAEEFNRKILACYENNTYVEHFECHLLGDEERGERWFKHWSQPITSGRYAGGRLEHYYDITEHKMTENILRSSGHFLRTIISSVNEGIVVYDSELRYQLWNEVMEKMTGMTAKQVLGGTATDFFPHLESEGILGMLKRALAGETIRSGDLFYWIPQTGKSGWVTGVYSPRLDNNGKIVGVIATIYDISERKQAEQKLRESEEKYRSIFNAAKDAIIIVDHDTGRILDVNESACKLYGFTLEEMLKLKVADTSAEPEETLGGIRAEVNEIPLRYHKKQDGTVFPVEISASFYSQNGRRLITAVVRDITARKRAEEALRSSQQKLRYLTSKLITAQEQEQKRISKELHDELGQALLALKLQTRSIEQKLGNRNPGLRSKCLEMLAYIDEVVENVHRLSRDLSPLILENLGLSSALRWLVEDVSKRSRVEYSIEVQDIEGIFTPSSQILIYRIFQECLTNIAKHAQASQMSLFIQRKRGSVVFRVEDNGRGFDPDRVVQGGVVNRGLGLTAMDERVRMLGGTLKIDSSEAAGTKVTFEIPLNNQ
jgi:PAS domain S-box-containing protein